MTTAEILAQQSNLRPGEFMPGYGTSATNTAPGEFLPTYTPPQRRVTTPSITTVADAIAAQQATGGVPSTRAYIDPTNPGAIAAGARQAYQGAQATQQFNRQIAPNLPSALLPAEVNANRFAYLNQLAAQAAGGPSVQTNDMLAAPAVRSTGPGGRPSLTQNPASLMAAAQGLTPQAWNQSRTAQLANAYAESQTPQPRPMSITLPSGAKVEGYTDPNGNFSRVAPAKEAAPDLTQLGKLYAERDAAVQSGRFDIAQAYDDTIKNYIAKGGKEAPVDPAAAAAFVASLMGVKPATPPAATPASPAAQPAPAAAPAAPIPTYRIPAQPAAAAAPATPPQTATANQDSAAAAWARANPNDPRAARILAHLNARAQ